MSERSARLAALFARAVELDHDDRRRLLDAECADDAALRQELDRLLAADRGPAAALLDRAFDGPGLQQGDLVAGRYRVRRQVGEGGMGVVFEAEQVEPRRRVALKCIRAAWLDNDSLQRFRREAEALGRLQHPGVAQVFEAGVTDGEPPVPFLAMEFVDGTGLLECARSMPMRGRLLLLAGIAEAVGHAHERGVVHRDIKPSNVLVETGSAGPRPRVLDFGVARFAEGDAALRTRTHQIIGTLAYLSPEQLQHGSAIADARSDVWALGVTAYELLAGRLPFLVGELGFGEAARVLRDEEPPRLDRLQPSLRGDVTTIVHKALAKDPARRYADARALAADLRRCLADQPITARPASAFYVASRLVRRHRGLFVGLGVAFVVMAAGLVVTIVLAARADAARERAERRSQELRGLVRTIVRDVDRELRQVNGTVEVRRQLLAAGLTHASAMVADDDAEPAALLEVASLYEELGRVQGTPGSANLGDVGAALASMQQALRLVERAIAAAPTEVRWHSARQRVLQGVESLLRASGRHDERLANLAAQRQQAAAIAELAPGPDADYAIALASANLGRAEADLGRLDAALANFQPLLAWLEKELHSEVADDAAEARQNLQVLLGHVGLLQERRNEVAAARAAFERAVALADAAVADGGGAPAEIDAVRTRRALATHLVQRGEAKGALTLLLEARQRITPVVAADADNVGVLRLAAIVEFGVGDAQVAVGEVAAGLDTLRGYLQRMAAMAAKFPQLARDLIPGRQSLAQQLAKAGEFAEAEEVAQAAVDLARQRAEASPSQAMAQDDLLLSLGNLAFVLEKRAAAPAAVADDRRRAADALQAALTFARQLEAAGQLDPQRRGKFAEWQARIDALRSG